MGGTLCIIPIKQKLTISKNNCKWNLIVFTSFKLLPKLQGFTGKYWNNYWTENRIKYSKLVVVAGKPFFSFCFNQRLLVDYVFFLGGGRVYQMIVGEVILYYILIGATLSQFVFLWEITQHGFPVCTADVVQEKGRTYTNWIHLWTAFGCLALMLSSEYIE